MAYLPIAHVGVNGAANGATTGNIDTTGADLIIVQVTGLFSTNPTLSDSKSNTWLPLTKQSTSSDGFSRLYYCQAPIVGSGHNFTVAGASSFSGCTVAAFSGSAASPFDLESGANVSATSIQPGSITPSQDGDLVICGVETNLNTDFNTAAAINGGFTITDRQPSVGSQGFAQGLAYLIQTTAAPANPTWSWTSSFQASSPIACFKAAGVTPPPSQGLMMMGLAM